MALLFSAFLFWGTDGVRIWHLPWNDLDFEKCTVKIVKASAYVDGETYMKETKMYFILHVVFYALLWM